MTSNGPHPAMRDDLDTSPFGQRRPSRSVARLLELTRRQRDDWTGRRLAYFLRQRAIERLTGPVDTEVLGANMRLYPFSNMSEKRILFTPQFFDPAERALIRARLREDLVFLDIGANVGGYALAVAAAAGPQARILAVEPQPGIFERLIYNIAQNPFGTIKAVACAVGDADGELTLFLDTHNRGESSVKIVPSDRFDGGSVRVPAKTLLRLAREEQLARIDVAKLDVEGAEDIVLAPFLRDAPKALWPRFLIIEHIVGGWHRDVRAMLVEHGYRQVLETRINVAFELA